jgi:hypothetical protein
MNGLQNLLPRRKDLLSRHVLIEQAMKQRYKFQVSKDRMLVYRMSKRRHS